VNDERKISTDSAAVDNNASTPGRLEAIWVKRARGGKMDAAQQVTLAAKKGIVGNANWGGWRQVTIMEKEIWDSVTSSLGVTLDPSTRRANLMVSGIELIHSRDKVVSIGGVRIKMVNETAPCNLMEESCSGLKDALKPNWRGGAFGYVIDDGEITVGDDVCWVEEEA
jgi:MOSC domain-containing protein YiiM|tara:strand:+ start:472 stop:975 length:504 start_codon:yes stop_codon:yes gene_type:complete